MYYTLYCNNTVGPMDASQLVSYPITMDTMVSEDGTNWQPLYKYPELVTALSAKNATVSGAAPMQYARSSQRLAFGLLALLIGSLGIQYFIIGKTTAGILTIILSLVTCGLWSVLVFVQGIVVLCMNDAEFIDKFQDSPKTFPLF